MFKIGDFSKFSRVSVKTLRYYDEIGLLKPETVDSNTGYRYYSAEQLPRLNSIVGLKELGMNLPRCGVGKVNQPFPVFSHLDPIIVTFKDFKHLCH